MTAGRLIAVVGPSGVGKDSLMQGIHQTLPNIHLVRRVITRKADLGGEAYDAVSVARFEAMAQAGAFAVHWTAHGLRYGIPIDVTDRLARGTDCLANVSRGALLDAGSLRARLVVLHVTAQPTTLAKRLAARGRETEDEIAGRLAQAQRALPEGLDVIHLSNDGPLASTVARACALLQPAGV